MGNSWQSSTAKSRSTEHGSRDRLFEGLQKHGLSMDLGNRMSQQSVSESVWAEEGGEKPWFHSPVSSGRVGKYTKISTPFYLDFHLEDLPSGPLNRWAKWQNWNGEGLCQRPFKTIVFIQTHGTTCFLSKGIEETSWLHLKAVLCGLWKILFFKRRFMITWKRKTSYPSSSRERKIWEGRDCPWLCLPNSYRLNSFLHVWKTRSWFVIASMDLPE